MSVAPTKIAQVSKMKKPLNVQDFVPVGTLLLAVILSAITSANFLTPTNIFNILRQNASVIVISMGMLLVVLTGGIDLSVGSLWGLAAVVVAMLSNSYQTTLAVLFTIVILTAVGAFTGYLVAYRRLAPFIVTLAVMSISASPGVAYIISNNGAQQNLGVNSWLKGFEAADLFGIPLSVLFAFFIFALVALVLRFTAFGRLVKAIGSNETAVRLSGIRVRLLKLSVYAVSGGLCALAGIMAAARNGSAKFNFGSGMELQAIAAVVIGGASLAGGKGTALNTLMGVLVLGLIRNIMNLLKVGTAYQSILTGVIILLAVLLQSFRSKEQ